MSDSTENKEQSLNQAWELHLVVVGTGPLWNGVFHQTFLPVLTNFPGCCLCEWNVCER